MSEPPLPAPVAEIERRLKWRVLALGGFLAIIVALAAVAAVSLLVPAPLVTGLPEDTRILAVSASLHGRVPVRADGLRFRSALTGEAAPDSAAGASTELLDRAEELLAAGRARHRRDPRLEVALAHLDLARATAGAVRPGDGASPEARAAWRRIILGVERRYRAILDRGVDAPEARLGLGFSLALEARGESDELRARALDLEAIAQWASADPRDPAGVIALYDRALLLDRVGRRDDALRAAREYLGFDPASAWARRLRTALRLP